MMNWLSSGVLLSDGAWGTEMQRRGLAAGEVPDAWNLSNPGQVEDVARAYVEAGSQVILTNTFRSNRISLAGTGLSGRVAELNRAGVRASRQAAAGRALVFASIGPSGKMLMAGEVTEDGLLAAFEEQAAAQAEAGADALLVETMSDIAEARQALVAARKTGLPVVVSFVFDTGKNKDRTMMGQTPEQAAKAMAEEGAAAVGANCGAGIERFAPICRRLKEACALPVWIKANAGLPELRDGQVCYPSSPDEFAGHVPALLEAGAGVVGGCCGTTPDFIRAVAKVLGR